MDALSRREDDLLMKELRAEAHRHCQAETEAFSKYSEMHTLSLAWGEGRKLFLAMRNCMSDYLTEERIDAAKSATLRERRAKYRYEERQWKERVEREREELRKQKAAGGDMPMAGLRLPPMLAKAEETYEEEQRKRKEMPKERMV